MCIYTCIFGTLCCFNEFIDVYLYMYFWNIIYGTLCCFKEFIGVYLYMYFWNIIYGTFCCFREFIDVCCRPTPGSGISSTVGFFANKLNYSSKVKSFSQSTWETWHLWHLWHFATLINMIMTSRSWHQYDVIFRCEWVYLCRRLVFRWLITLFIITITILLTFSHQ